MLGSNLNFGFFFNWNPPLLFRTAENCWFTCVKLGISLVVEIRKPRTLQNRRRTKWSKVQNDNIKSLNKHKILAFTTQFYNSTDVHYSVCSPKLHKKQQRQILSPIEFFVHPHSSKIFLGIEKRLQGPYVSQRLLSSFFRGSTVAL